MNKKSKKVTKIFSRIGLVLLGLLILLVFALNSSLLQTKLLNRWLAQQSREMGILARVQSVNVDLFSRQVRLFGVEIYDHHQNLLLDAGTLQTFVRGFSASHLTLGTTHIFDIVFNLRRYEEDNVSNLKHIISLFNTSPKDPDAPKLAIKTSAVFLKNADFSFVDEAESRGDTFQFIDFKNVFLNDIHFSARNIDIVGDNVLATIENLAFKEKNGFDVLRLSTRLNLSSRGIIARNLDIITSLSDLELDLRLTTESWEDYRDFISNVRVYANFKNSYLNFEDLVYFAPKLEGKHNQFRISGSVLGYVNNFRAVNFETLYGRNTRFYGNIMMSGLPKFDTTFFDVSIENFTTTPEDIDIFLLPNANKITIPDELHKLGKTSLSGQLTGFISDLEADVNLTTAVGYVKTNFKFSHDTAKDFFDFSGYIDHANLALGHVLNEEKIGNNLDLSGSFDGNFSTKHGMDLSTNMILENMEYQNRNVSTISVKGDWMKQLISAVVSMEDDNGTAEFSGELSFDPENSYLDVSGFFKDIDLTALQLLNDTNQPLLSFDFFGKIDHFNIDSLTGYANVSDLHVVLKDTMFHLNSFNVSQQILSQGFSTKLDCDFFRVDVFGNYKFSNLNAIWNDIQKNYLSALRLPAKETESLEYRTFHLPEENLESARKHTTSQTLDLTLNVHKTGGLLSYFLPDIHLPQGADLELEYNGNYQPLSLALKTKKVTAHGISISNLNLKGSTHDSIFGINVDAKNLHIGDNRYFEDFVIVAKLENDTVSWKFDWIGLSEENKKINGKFDGNMRMLEKNKMSFNIQNSELLLSDQYWQFDPNNRIVIDSTGVHLKNIRFFNQNDSKEYLSLNGELSRIPNSTLDLAFNRYQLAPFAPLIERIGLDFDGAISGHVKIFDFYTNLRFDTDLKIEDFSINRFNYGTAFLRTKASQSISESYINFDIRNNEKNYLLATGYFYPNREGHNLNLKISISELDLVFLKKYVESFSSSLTGKFGGELTLNGPLKKPNLYGDLKFNNAVVKIDFLNTYYAVTTEKIKFSLDSVIFVGGRLEDVLNSTKGALSGGLYHHRFKDFRLNLDLQMNNFFALNTTHLHNETFFGKVFMTGHAHLGGPANNILIDVQGRTERGTELQVNHSSRANISEANQFIHFMTPKKDLDTIQNELITEVLPTNMTVRLNIDLTPDASVFFDMDSPPISGLVNAQGSGNLRLNFESRTQHFAMFGDYVLQDGFYDFTFEDKQLGRLITRRFYMERGGTIQWTGDPGNAILNISAIYSTRASLAPVLSSSLSLNNNMRRVNVQSVISLAGRMSQPDIKFDFRLPNVDDDIRTEFFSVINRDDENEMTKQTFFLLLFGGFTAPGDNSNIALNQDVNATSMAWDMLLSQANSILQNFSDNFNFSVNHRPVTATTYEQTQVTMSTQFFDNRLLIDGHVGFSKGDFGNLEDPTRQQTIMGEFNAEYRITDRFSLKAFSRPNEREFSRMSSQLGYLQGGGITYRREFDAFRPLFNRRRED